VRIDHEAEVTLAHAVELVERDEVAGDEAPQGGEERGRERPVAFDLSRLCDESSDAREIGRVESLHSCQKIRRTSHGFNGPRDRS